MPIITILILVDLREDKARQGKTRWNIYRFVAYNDNDNDNDNDYHYSMNSDGMKIISL